MPSGVSYSVDWQEIRKASEQGVSDVALEEQYGVPRNAIKQRRFREDWITPAKLAEAAEIASIKAKRSNRVTDVTGKQKSPSALAVTAENLGEKAAAYSLKVFEAASKLAQKGLKELPIPDDWKSFNVADQVVRRAAGLDKPQTAVQVNLGGFFRPADDEGCLVIESQNVESTINLDDF